MYVYFFQTARSLQVSQPNPGIRFSFPPNISHADILSFPTPSEETLTICNNSSLKLSSHFSLVGAGAFRTLTLHYQTSSTLYDILLLQHTLLSLLLILSSYT